MSGAAAALSARRRILALLLLLPSAVIIIGFFIVPMFGFYQYGFYSFVKGKIIETFTFDTFKAYFTDPFYARTMVLTLKSALYTTGIALVVGYFTAYAFNKVKSPAVQRIVSITLFLPLVVSLVVLSYGWLVLLSGTGIVNYLALRLGLIHEPAKMVYNEFGVRVALVHSLLPFMVFPISSALGQIKPVLKESASDLGANWLVTFVRITLPLSLHGVISGIRLFFTLCMGSFVVPFLLGGGRVNLVAGAIYNDMIAMNWPNAAVAAMFLLVLCTGLLLGLDRLARRFMYLEGAK